MIWFVWWCKMTWDNAKWHFSTRVKSKHSRKLKVHWEALAWPHPNRKEPRPCYIQGQAEIVPKHAGAWCFQLLHLTGTQAAGFVGLGVTRARQSKSQCPWLRPESRNAKCRWRGFDSHLSCSSISYYISYVICSHLYRIIFEYRYICM